MWILEGPWIQDQYIEINSISMIHWQLENDMFKCDKLKCYRENVTIYNCIKLSKIVGNKTNKIFAPSLQDFSITSLQNYP